MQYIDLDLSEYLSSVGEKKKSYCIFMNFTNAVVTYLLELSNYNIFPLYKESTSGMSLFDTISLISKYSTRLFLC